MANSTVFTSKMSWDEAATIAKQSGYRVTGKARNPRTGEFVVFAKPMKWI